MRDGARARGQRGQTVVIVALGMVAFLGFLGVVLDGGSAYLARQNLQKSADLAAVSGAWAYYHAAYQESDNYGSVTTAMTAATRAVDTTLAVNGYSGAAPQLTFIDAAGTDLATNQCPAGPACPQGWEIRGVRIQLSRVLATQILQSVGIGSSTIAATARAQLGPSTGARHEAPLLLQNFSAGNNLPRAHPYAVGAPCDSAPPDGQRYGMNPDCRPSTGNWSQGAQALNLEPVWGTAPPMPFPFSGAPTTRFFLLHESPTTIAPTSPATEQTAVTNGLDEFLATCAALCSGASPVYADTADTQGPANPVRDGMLARINSATAPAGRWAAQACGAPHDPVNPLTPDNPRLVRLPVTYGAGSATADARVGGFLVSETVMYCVDLVSTSGSDYVLNGYLVETPSSEPTVLRPGDSYFGRDVVVKLLS